MTAEATEQAGPPTQQDRIIRDIEYVRTAQIRYREGYLARLAEQHPKKRNAAGKTLTQDEPKWRFCDLRKDDNGDLVANPAFARARCPHFPAHESERWVAGYLHADNLCALYGLSHARARYPARTARKKRESVAEQLEACPGAILSKQDARLYHERQERTRNGQSATLAPTTVDG